MKQTTTPNENQVSDFINEFCPFGYLDCKAAVQAALDAGENPRWAAEQVQEFADSTGSKIEDCDPVYCVYDSLMQSARNEIDELTGFDLCNDMDSGHIDVYGNFMCTSFDVSEDAKTQLIGVLAASDIDIEDLDEKTQWFLSEIEISQDDINAIVSEINNAGE